jgi:hypothetical protein
MSISATPTTIRALIGVTCLKDCDLAVRLNAVHQGLVRNPQLFPRPWISLEEYKAAIDAFVAAVSAARNRTEIQPDIKQPAGGIRILGGSLRLGIVSCSPTFPNSSRVTGLTHPCGGTPWANMILFHENQT